MSQIVLRESTDDLSIESANNDFIEKDVLADLHRHAQ